MALAPYAPPVGIVDAHGRGQLHGCDGSEEGGPAFFAAGIVRQAVHRTEKLLDRAVASFVVIVEQPMDLFEQTVEMCIRDSPNWSRLAARPEVAQLAVWDLFFCNIYGQEGGVLFASGGNGWLSSVDKPVVLAGRMFNPKADDEVVVNDQLAAAEDIHVGAVVPVQAYALDQPLAVGTPHGPMMKLRVVGIVRTSEELLFVPNVMVSPGVVAKYLSLIHI